MAVTLQPIRHYHTITPSIIGTQPIKWNRGKGVQFQPYSFFPFESGKQSENGEKKHRLKPLAEKPPREGKGGIKGCLVRKDGKVFVGEIIPHQSGVEVRRDFGPYLFFDKGQIRDILPLKKCRRGKKENKKIVQKQTKTIQLSPKKEFHGEPLSIDVVDAQLIDVLTMIADVAKLNLLSAPGVQGKVTLHLHDVPWDQILDLLSRMYHFYYSIEGNVLFVRKLSSK